MYKKATVFSFFSVVLVLIEKLLRSCGDIDTLYVLVRPKKGKDPVNRLHDMLDEFVSTISTYIFPKTHTDAMTISVTKIIHNVSCSKTEMKALF